MIEFPALIEDFAALHDDVSSEYVHEIWKDYWICNISREASISARKEVLTGKAKFGIVGDGKEVPQVALARAFKKGDFKAGYYRDQTFMMAIGACSIEDFFAQLYADQENDPFSAGRQMNCHFSSDLLDKTGNWLDQTKNINLSSDISCTGGQMGRALGHALATKLFRNNEELSGMELFSDHGEGVTVVTIGDASTSEGAFWETINAAAVMKVPLATCVWDDGYGISVPIEMQTVKSSISKALEGFYLDESNQGIRIYAVKGWDYPALVETFEAGINKMRKSHIPALFHVQEVTQPQGHSTSGSHERYKTPERLQWEKDMDGILCMGEWMIESGFATQQQLDEVKAQAKEYVKKCKQTAWDAFLQPVKKLKADLLIALVAYSTLPSIKELVNELQSISDPVASELMKIARKARIHLSAGGIAHEDIKTIIDHIDKKYGRTLHSHLTAEGTTSPLLNPGEEAQYDHSEKINGYQVLNKYFDRLFARKPEVVAFGEDVGNIGDVNQGMAGIQARYGVNRIFDTGIREWTIVSQAIGLAMRGFRPIAEIQYLDYIYFALSPLSDDLATLRYRSNGKQAAPAIIRTRGHRLEGIWHTGSPLGMLVNSLQGMHVCVPRNMTQAAGMYNTLMEGMDPALVIECLNGYRLKEQCPVNLDTFSVPLGVPDILQEGTDVTLVTYGSCVRVAQEAIQLLSELDISVELIDVQTLLPFDIYNIIGKSLAKTNRLVLLDEDIPGGATAFMLQKILEVGDGYFSLDAKPVCITAHAHRTPFGSDGDYFSKPNAEDVTERILRIVNE
ncbi:MAG: transketolase [Saprospiraceae bacterium]|nr:transketolase [Saprospiraceae bacterium]